VFAQGLRVMGKCTPIAAKILAMREMALMGRPIPAVDFLEIFSWVVDRRVPPNLAALIRESQIDQMLRAMAGGRAGRSVSRAIARQLAGYASTSYPRDRAKPAPPTGSNRILYLILETNRGRVLSAERIRKRLQSAGSKLPGSDDPANQEGLSHENDPICPEECNAGSPDVPDRSAA
jgi:hypothetical protein